VTEELRPIWGTDLETLLMEWGDHDDIKWKFLGTTANVDVYRSEDLTTLIKVVCGNDPNDALVLNINLLTRMEATSVFPWANAVFAVVNISEDT